MLSEHFQVCRFAVEADFCVGPVAEGFVAGAPTSAQGSEDFAVKVDKVRTVLGGLDLNCMHETFRRSNFYLRTGTKHSGKSNLTRFGKEERPI
jgi:hypothetical protein